MRLIVNKLTDPVFNLALEEYLLTKTDMELFMLWRNERTVVIGSNQNAIEEIDVDYIKKNNITLVRRISGGGAVFHDLGNINFTIIRGMRENDFNNYEKFSAPICEFLQLQGLGVRLEGRNDIVIDGQKISGNAQAVRKNRIMHHGTLLYDTNFFELEGSLRPRNAKIVSKSIKSIRARVTNIASKMPLPVSTDMFFNMLASYLLENIDNNGIYSLSANDIAETQVLVREKYSKWDWNFGKSPNYNYEKCVKFQFGLVDLKLKVTSGIIKDINIFGDYFGICDRTELESRLKNVRHDKDSIAHIIADVELTNYICGITQDEFLSLF